MKEFITILKTVSFLFAIFFISNLVASETTSETIKNIFFIVIFILPLIIDTKDIS